MARVLDDWFKAYGEYTSTNEAAEIFHIWVALGAVSGAAQRKIFIRMKHFMIHSNVYLLLVAPPGRGRKTTALKIGKNILREIEPKVNFSSESGSFQAIVRAMALIGKTNHTHQSMTLVSSELGTLMKTDTAAMVDWITDIYDCSDDWTRDTIAHGIQTIARPWLSIWGGTTPAWLSENAGVVAIEGGLTARCIISHSDKRILKTPRDKETLGDRELRKTLVRDLSHISLLEGEFDFSRDAGCWFDRWYMDESRFPALTDNRTAGYYDRKPIHLLKIAMLLSLSYKDELVLELDDVQRALALLDATEPGMKIALNAVGKNEWAAIAMYVLAQIRSKPAVTYQQLLIANFHNLGKKNLDAVLDDLRMRGDIRYESQHWIATGANVG